ncbi:MAG: hypothetical protein HUJ80_01000 [Firmicutes bacterium]|nr:hypothetical protein [Bacillota bacterium]
MKKIGLFFNFFAFGYTYATDVKNAVFSRVSVTFHAPLKSVTMRQMMYILRAARVTEKACV